MAIASLLAACTGDNAGPPKPVVSVAVTPLTAPLPVGTTLQLTATPKDGQGNALSGRTITWSSSDSAVATVSQSGVASGVTLGAATLTAKVDGVAGATILGDGSVVLVLDVLRLIEFGQSREERLRAS